jgi:hypothetical protein
MFISRLFEEIEGVVHGFGTADKTLEEYLGGFDDLVIPSTDQVHGNTVHVLGSGLGFSCMRPDPAMPSLHRSPTSYASFGPLTVFRSLLWIQ